MGKRDYLNDFVLNDKGEYEYKGNHFVLNSNEPLKLKKELLIWLCLSGITTLISGVIPFEGMTGFALLVLSYLAEIIIFAFLVYANMTVLKHFEKMREYQYKKSFPRLIPLTGSLLGISVVSAILVCIYTFMNTQTVTIMYAIIVFLCKGLNVFACRNLSKLYNQLNYSEEKR